MYGRENLKSISIIQSGTDFLSTVYLVPVSGVAIIESIFATNIDSLPGSGYFTVVKTVSGLDYPLLKNKYLGQNDTFYLDPVNIYLTAGETLRVSSLSKSVSFNLSIKEKQVIGS